MSTQPKPKPEPTALHNLKAHRARMGEIDEELTKLHAARAEQQGIAGARPDLADLRNRITDALADGEQAEIDRLKAELDHAKAKTGRIDSATARLGELAGEIQAAHDRRAAMAGEEKPLIRLALEEETKRRAETCRVKFEEFVHAHIEAVTLAGECEKLGPVMTAMHSGIGAVVDCPSPVMAMTPSGRFRRHIGLNDPDVIAARAAAAGWLDAVLK